MRRPLLPLLGLAAVTLTSCLAGPHQLRRSVDDWDHRTYVESPWLDVGLWIVPVIPVASICAAVGDFLIVDPVFFWGSDAWDGAGTGFEHYRVHANLWAESLLSDRSKWTRVEQHDLPDPREVPRQAAN